MEIVVRFWIWESIHLRAAKRRRSSLRLFGYGSEVTSSLTLLVNYILFCVKLCSDLSIRQTVHSGQTPAPDGKSEITSLRSWMQLVLCFWIWKSIHLRSAKRRRSSLRFFGYNSEVTSLRSWMGIINCRWIQIAIRRNVAYPCLNLKRFSAPTFSSAWFRAYIESNNTIGFSSMSLVTWVE